MKPKQPDRTKPTPRHPARRARDSDRIWQDIRAGRTERYRILTGDRPTGFLHIGHYFGTLKSRVELQNLGIDTTVLIADYQVITDRDNIGNVREYVLNLVADYLAAGLTREVHDFLPLPGAAIHEMLVIFLSLVTEAELHRNPTVKAEMEAAQRPMTGLLLTYPVHQAADILCAQANLVPVGQDQLPHLEQTRWPSGSTSATRSVTRPGTRSRIHTGCCRWHRLCWGVVP
ncbi:tryptophan--tRNA ligase [Mobiluncus mulieris]|uniref:tryptophan--tRNA ligase n=1 Tax=Mobiluncus mulieris TaxID=2052 RepID=UPI0026C85F2E